MVRTGDRFKAVNEKPPDFERECLFQKWAPSDIIDRFWRNETIEYRMVCRLTLWGLDSRYAIDCDTKECPIYSIYTQSRQEET